MVVGEVGATARGTARRGRRRSHLDVAAVSKAGELERTLWLSTCSELSWSELGCGGT